MPLRNYKCSGCDEEYRKLLQSEASQDYPCPKCGNSNFPLLPATVNARVYETRDKYRGKQLMKNHERIQKKRLRDHHDRYELEEKIDKHGMNDAKRYGWLKKIKKL